jgi:hypothetical protein
LFFCFRPAITELGAMKVASAAAGGTDGAFDLSIFVYFYFFINHALGISVWLAGWFCSRGENCYRLGDFL